MKIHPSKPHHTSLIHQKNHNKQSIVDHKRSRKLITYKKSKQYKNRDSIPSIYHHQSPNLCCLLLVANNETVIQLGCHCRNFITPLYFQIKHGGLMGELKFVLGV
jgi:hypothetical protein